MKKTMFPRNESVIIKNEVVIHDDNIGELVLTNLNLYFTHVKGGFTKQKITMQYQLSKINIFNDRAHVIIGNNGTLEIFFTNEAKTFRFRVLEGSFKETKARNEAVKWAKIIDQIVTGKESDINLIDEVNASDSEIISKALKGTINSLKEAVGIKTKKEVEKVYEKTTKKCWCCGATMSGFIGNVYKCEYCDTDQKL